MKILNSLLGFLLLGTLQLSAQEYYNPEGCNAEPVICCEVPPAAEPYSCRGKFELAPTYIHVDFLKSGHTLHTADFAAIRSDFNYRIWQGLTLKPVIMYGHGKKDNEILTGGIGLGFCIPLHCVPLDCKIVITPVVGYSWGYVRSSFDFEHPLAPGMHIHVKERFRSRSPYVGIEMSWTFIPTWRLGITYQYAWSRTHSKILPKEKPDEPFGRSKSEGSVISGMIEHDFNDSFSINLGAAYNNSLSKERDGIRGWGMKLGFAYWF